MSTKNFDQPDTLGNIQRDLRRSSRRQFMNAACVTAATLVSAPYIAPACALGGRHGSANDRIRVGEIGTSIYVDRYTGGGNHPGRGALVGHLAGELGNMVAVADVNRLNADFFSERYNGNCKIYNDYLELIARQDIDAVTIGTPDHWHAKIAIDAMRAGKHVYCEKPLALTIREGQQICKVAMETGKVFQVGTQQRSEFAQVFLKAVAIAQSGILGDKLQMESIADGTLNQCEKQEVLPMAWSPLAGGRIFDSGNPAAVRLEIAAKEMSARYSALPWSSWHTHGSSPILAVLYQ